MLLNFYEATCLVCCGQQTQHEQADQGPPWCLLGPAAASQSCRCFHHNFRGMVCRSPWASPGCCKPPCRLCKLAALYGSLYKNFELSCITKLVCMNMSQCLQHGTGIRGPCLSSTSTTHTLSLLPSLPPLSLLTSPAPLSLALSLSEASHAPAACVSPPPSTLLLHCSAVRSVPVPLFHALAPHCQSTLNPILLGRSPVPKHLQQ